MQQLFAYTILLSCRWTRAGNQLRTRGGAKSFLRGAQIFWTVSNSFKLCPRHFTRGGEHFAREASPLWLFILGTLLEGSRPLMSYRLALYVSKLFQFITILLYCESSITKKPAVKLSGNTPIAYLLSSLYNCTVCKCQELALNKAPVLRTTPNSLLLF